MAFPDYKIVTKEFLGFKWKQKVPDGWENLGACGDRGYSSMEHSICKSHLHLGKENEKVFRYCKRCMIKDY